MDAYDILGVARGASLEKVKTNFRKLALELHPDKGGSEHLFNVLKKSYVQVLQDIKEKRNNKDFHELKEDHEEFKRTEQQMKHMHIDEEKEDDKIVYPTHNERKICVLNEKVSLGLFFFYRREQCINFSH